MVVAIIQARMGSTRLLGKVLIPIEGKPLLQHIVERVRKSRLIDTIVIATTVNEQDKPVLAMAHECNVDSFTGSEEDVLDRFYQAAKEHSADTIVRITADDPFKDPQVIDKVIGRYLDLVGTVDYVSNTIKPTYPLGLDAEVFSFGSLERAWREANDPFEREHVTPYIWRHPEIFSLANVENEENLSHLRWTLDTEADLDFTREVYSRLYGEGNIFLMKEILDLLDESPWLTRLNMDAA